MYHSITFGNKNTWDDWHLVPVSRPKFNTPPVKTKIINVQGGNGIIDESESLTGYPIFGNREGSFEFVVLNDYKSWEQAYSDICDYLHGRVMRAILEDDPDYYYEGRFSVNEWRSEQNNSRIVINYSVAPYKVKSKQSTTDVIYVTPTSDKDGISFGKDFYGEAPSCPTITIATTGRQGVTARFVNSTLGINETKHLSDGTIQVPEFVFYGDSSVIYFQVAYATYTLEDSEGEQILDSSGNPIKGTASGNVTVSTDFGRL